MMNTKRTYSFIESLSSGNYECDCLLKEGVIDNVKNKVKKIFNNEEEYEAFFKLGDATCYLIKSIEGLISCKQSQVESIKERTINDELYNLSTEDSFFKNEIYKLMNDIIEYEVLLYKNKHFETTLNVILSELKKSNNKEEENKKRAIAIKLRKDIESEIKKNQKSICDKFDFVINMITDKKEICYDFINYYKDNIENDPGLFDNMYIRSPKREAKITVTKAEIADLEKDLEEAFSKHAPMEKLQTFKDKLELRAYIIRDAIVKLEKQSKNIKKLINRYVLNPDNKFIEKIYNIYDTDIAEEMTTIGKTLGEIEYLLFYTEKIIGITLKTFEDPVLVNQKRDMKIGKNAWDNPDMKPAKIGYIV